MQTRLTTHKSKNVIRCCHGQFSQALHRNCAIWTPTVEIYYSEPAVFIYTILTDTVINAVLEPVGQPSKSSTVCMQSSAPAINVSQCIPQTCPLPLLHSKQWFGLRVRVATAPSLWPTFIVCPVTLRTSTRISVRTRSFCRSICLRRDLPIITRI